MVLGFIFNISYHRQGILQVLNLSPLFLLSLSRLYHSDRLPHLRCLVSTRIGSSLRPFTKSTSTLTMSRYLLLLPDQSFWPFPSYNILSSYTFPCRHTLMSRWTQYRLQDTMKILYKGLRNCEKGTCPPSVQGRGLSSVTTFLPLWLRYTLIQYFPSRRRCNKYPCKCESPVRRYNL